MKHFGILLKKQLEVFFWVELHSLFTPMVSSLVMLSLIIKMRSLQLKKGTIHILRNHLLVRVFGVGSKNKIFCLFSIPMQIPCAAIDGFFCKQAGMYSHQFFEDTVTLLPYSNQGGGGRLPSMGGLF